MIKDSTFLPNENISPGDQGGRDLPDYDETFGNVAEDIIRGSIGKKAALIVEKVEKGTKPEDYRGKVDFWIKFAGIEQPVGIQYTISDNEVKIKEKLDFLRSVSNIAKKEKRSDSEIDWAGNANVVLIRGDKRKMARCWEESQKTGVNQAELIDETFLKNFFRQVFVAIGEINPALRAILYNAMERAVKNKKGGEN